MVELRHRILILHKESGTKPDQPERSEAVSPAKYQTEAGSEPCECRSAREPRGPVAHWTRHAAPDFGVRVPWPDPYSSINGYTPRFR